MSIQNRRSSRTREKSCSCLKSATKHSKPKSNPKAKRRRPRELTLRSLKKLINQMKEEIARFESRVSSSTERG